jgi:peptidoglycan hydrolase-like amidase
VHTWSVKAPARRLERAWPAVGDLRRIAVLRRDGHGDWGGRVSSIRLRGTKGRVTLPGDTFRSVLGLRSTWVTFRVR